MCKCSELLCLLYYECIIGHWDSCVIDDCHCCNYIFLSSSLADNTAIILVLPCLFSLLATLHSNEFHCKALHHCDLIHCFLWKCVIIHFRIQTYILQYLFIEIIFSAKWPYVTFHLLLKEQNIILLVMVVFSVTHALL